MSVFFFAGRDCYAVRFDRRKDHTLDNYLMAPRMFTR